MGVELLRVLSMFLIVLLHYFTFGGIFSQNELTPNANYWIGKLYQPFDVGVNCFVLISGYFLSTSNHFTWQKVAKLWLPIFFYSVVIFALFLAFSGREFSVYDLFHAIFPLRFNSYWFMTCYFGLYLLHPYLNLIIQGLNAKEYRKFLAIMIIMFSIISVYPSDGMQVVAGYSLIWFILIYFVGGYIRHFADSKYNPKWLLAIYIGTALLAFIGKFGLWAVFPAYYEHIDFANHFYYHNNILMLIASVALFLFFKNLTITNEIIIRGVKFFTPMLFGVYLIHANPYIIGILYKKFFASGYFVDSPFMILHWLAVSVAVFVGCALIDLVRIRIFELLKFK